MNNGNNNTRSQVVLSMLKKVWMIFSEILDRSEGLEMMERRIIELVAAYGKEAEDKIINRLIALLEVLDCAIKVEVNCRGVLQEVIAQVLKVLGELGAEAIEVKAGDSFDSYIHCAIGVEYIPALALGTVLDVGRRGFKVGTSIYPAEVIVSIQQERPEVKKAEEMKLATVGEKQVICAFDGGDVTSDTGALLLQEVDKTIGLVDKIAQVIEEKRDERYITHEVKDLVAQRIYQIAMGYEDGNDCNFLRHDPAFKTALQKDMQLDCDLASQPTMSRFENSVTENELQLMDEKLMEIFVSSYHNEPEIIVLDFDTTDDPTHGEQQMTLFNAYYDEHCYLPLHVYEGLSGKLVTAILRPGKTPSGSEIVTVLERIIGFIRKHWQHTLVLFRADSHFAAPEVLEFLEAKPNVLYCIGSSAGSSEVLKQQAALVRQEVKNLYPKVNQPVKRYTSFDYQAQSWNKARRVIAKAEFNEKGENTRFVITNIQGKAKSIYEDIYCARGNCENYIKDHKTYLKSDRTSCSSFLANRFRLVLHSAAYILLHTLKTQYLKDTAFANATVNTIQLRILKVAARVRSLKTRVRFSLPFSYPLKDLWCSLIHRLFPLRC